MNGIARNVLVATASTISRKNAPTSGMTRNAFGGGPYLAVTAFMLTMPTGVALISIFPTTTSARYGRAALNELPDNGKLWVRDKEHKNGVGNRGTFGGKPLTKDYDAIHFTSCAHRVIPINLLRDIESRMSKTLACSSARTSTSSRSEARRFGVQVRRGV